MTKKLPSALLLTSVLCAAALAAGCASQRSAMGAGPASSAAAPAPAAAAARLSMTDTAFANTAAASGMYEVEVARMASTKATHPQVKSFAQMLVSQHTTANNELMALMRAKGMTPPAALPADLRSKADALGRLSGEQFDREFIRVAGVQDHTTNVALFEQAGRTVADADLKAWAAKTLPTLRAHLRDAQGIAGTLAG